jgi:hypothetical protein
VHTSAVTQENTAFLKVTMLNNEFGWKKRILAGAEWEEGGGGRYGGDFEYTLM